MKGMKQIVEEEEAIAGMQGMQGMKQIVEEEEASRRRDAEDAENRLS